MHIPLNKQYRILTLILIVTGMGIFSIQSCSKTDHTLDPNQSMQLTNEALQGGVNGSIALATKLAFAQPIPPMLTADIIDFKVGRSFFHTNWVTAPASTQAVDGLGPLFNATSCNSCHVEDGRGRTPFSEAESLSSVLIRVSIPGKDAHGGAMPDPRFGTQFRNHSILKAKPDGDVHVSYSDSIVTFPDGASDTLQVPHYYFSGLRDGAIPDFLYSPRIAPQLCGMGLLEAIPEQTIRSFADENDLNNDGISGRTNEVWNDETEKTELGRFGWKANVATVRDQVASALGGDMGITSPIYPEANLYGTAKTLYEVLPNGSDSAGESELPEPFFTNTVFYTEALAVPERRNWTDPEIKKGKILFAKLSCAKCHIPQVKTGDFPKIPLLAHQTIHPYTDLLIHDMGVALADGRPDFEATGNEWKTPPLWGIGLLSKVNNNHGMFLLHDGRARTIAEAILWHGGEAQQSKEAFMHLSKNERAELIKFVNDL